MTAPVTVVLPAFNGAAFIADAVRSVQRQGVEKLEIIVVDDGSSDATEDIVRGMEHVRYVRQSRGGPAAARNKGISLALGRLIAFIDQDDLWPTDHLAVLNQMLAAKPSTCVAMGMTQALAPAEPSGEAGARFAPYGEPWLAPHVGCALFRREAFARVGLLDATLRYGSDDLDWFMRAREQNLPIEEVDAVTLLFRIHERNASREKSFRRNALVEAIHASVQRRRKSGDG